VPPISPVLLTTYERVLPVSVERIWENVLDWEHLPGLHRHEFASIRLIEGGEWGWRASVRRARAPESRVMTVEVVLDRERLRYVTATVDGPGKGTEIRTRLTPRGHDGAHGIHVFVEFLVPDVPRDRAAEWAAGYERLYERLWDEDEAMMLRRERLSTRSRSEPSSPIRLELGSLADLRSRLPLVVEMAGRPWRIVALDGDLAVHSTVCPHRLGPLEDATVEDGVVECPWHRYRFDLRTGRSCDGRSLRLAPAPRIAIDEVERVALVLDPSKGPR
jgi:nitrite reductase/ring-hydroxylating ferredoxin subunit